MENFRSLNDEIKTTIIEKKTELDNEYKKLELFVNEFLEKMDNKCIEEIDEASKIVNWLRDTVVGVKILQKCFSKFPETEEQKVSYIFNDLSKLENENVSNEVLEIVMPLSSMLHTIFALRKL